jgi:Ca-activated chloride channel family protein
MQWRDPWSLLGLVLVAALAAFLAWAWRRRQRALAAFVEAALQPVVVPDVDPRRRRLRAGLLVSGALLLVVALAGPMWGFRWQQVERRGIDLVIALDTSRSMLADDVKPNRLARAKLGVRDLVAAARGDRLALVAFAGTAFLQCPLTLDTGAFLQSLDAIEVGIIPRGGTALAAAIESSLAAFEGREGNHQAVVLISDGESHEGDLDAAIARAKERGVRIFTVGIGTAEGELLRGQGGAFLKDRKGQVVKSRLDEATLERIAVDTGGVYLHAAGPGLGLTELYRDHIATLDERELESTLERRYELRYRIPLALAFLLLLLEPLVGDRRAAAGRRLARRRRDGAATAALALAVVSIGWLDPHARAREGNRLYDAGKFDEAAAQYNQALVDEPDSARLHFNLGDAQYKAGKYEEALASFGKVSGGDADPARRAHLAYNVGNTRYREGAAVEQQEPQKTLALWGEALAAYRRALGADPDDVDAKFNHELVEKKLAALRQRLEQQKQQQERQNEKQQNEKQQQGEKQQQDEKRQDQGQQRDQQRAESSQENQGQQQGEQRDRQQQSGDDRAQEEPREGEQNGADAQQARQDGSDTDGRRQGEDGAAQQPGEEEKGEAQAGQGEHQGQEGSGGRPGEVAVDDGRLDREQAAALLDAQRAQEVQPGEIVRRLSGARVAEPREDW